MGIDTPPFMENCFVYSGNEEKPEWALTHDFNGFESEFL